MKDDVFDLEGLEELMLRKPYAELSVEERRMVSRHVASESEYNDLRDTLVNVRKTLQEEKIVLRPRVDMKEALLKKFEEVHGQGGGATPMDNRPKKFHIPVFYRYASVAAVLLIAFLVVFNQFSGIGPKKTKDLAMQKTHSESPVPPTESTGMTSTELSEPATEDMVMTDETVPVTVTTLSGEGMSESEMISEESTISGPPGGETNPVFSSSREGVSTINDKSVTPTYMDLLAKDEKKSDDGVRSNAFENYGGYYTESQKLKNTTKEENTNSTNPTISSNQLMNTSVQGNTSFEQWGDNTSGNKTQPKMKTNTNLKSEIRRSLIYSDL